MRQTYLYLPGVTGKIRCQNSETNFIGIALVLYFDVLDDFWPAYSIGFQNCNVNVKETLLHLPFISDIG